MSYYCNCIYSDLLIPTEAVDMAVHLIRDEKHPGRCDANYLTQPNAKAWPDNIKRLYGLLDEWGVTHDTLPPKGTDIPISWDYDRWHLEDEAFFDVIAPVVREGGVIAFAGEDGLVWRYRYHGGGVFKETIDFKSNDGWV